MPIPFHAIPLVTCPGSQGTAVQFEHLTGRLGCISGDSQDSFYICTLSVWKPLFLSTMEPGILPLPNWHWHLTIQYNIEPESILWVAKMEDSNVGSISFIDFHNRIEIYYIQFTILPGEPTSWRLSCHQSAMKHTRDHLFFIFIFYWQSWNNGSVAEKNGSRDHLHFRVLSYES